MLRIGAVERSEGGRKGAKDAKPGKMPSLKCAGNKVCAAVFTVGQ